MPPGALLNETGRKRIIVFLWIFFSLSWFDWQKDLLYSGPRLAFVAPMSREEKKKRGRRKEEDGFSVPIADTMCKSASQRKKLINQSESSLEVTWHLKSALFSSTGEKYRKTKRDRQTNFLPFFLSCCIHVPPPVYFY